MLSYNEADEVCFGSAALVECITRGMTASGQNQPLIYQDLIVVLVGAAARGHQ